MCFEQFVYELLCNGELRDSFGFVYVRSFCLSRRACRSPCRYACRFPSVSRELRSSSSLRCVSSEVYLLLYLYLVIYIYFIYLFIYYLLVGYINSFFSFGYLAGLA